MDIDDEIKAKRLELQGLKSNVDARQKELHELFLAKARAMCPLEIGTIVEYEPGKKGYIDRIGYHVESWREIELDSPVNWVVTGKKINKTGERGIKDFNPVGPATHKFNGTSFKPKGIDGILGISND